MSQNVVVFFNKDVIIIKLLMIAVLLIKIAFWGAVIPFGQPSLSDNPALVSLVSSPEVELLNNIRTFQLVVSRNPALSGLSRG